MPLRFALQSLVFEIIEFFFYFSIGFCCEFDILDKKSLNIVNTKFQKSQSNFVKTIGRKFQDKFENFWLWFLGEVVFWNFRSHRVPC